MYILSISSFCISQVLMLVINILSVVVSLIYMFWLDAAIKTSEAMIPNDLIVRDNVLFYVSKSRYFKDNEDFEAFKNTFEGL